MFPYQHIVVDAKMEALRQDAAKDRLLPVKPGRASRLASALRTAWAAVTTPAPTTSTLTPTLSEYPYRS